MLIYQHLRREQRDLFTARLAAELRQRTGATFVEAFRTPHMVFLPSAQRRHAQVFEEAIAGDPH